MKGKARSILGSSQPQPYRLDDLIEELEKISKQGWGHLEVHVYDRHHQDGTGACEIHTDKQDGKVWLEA